MKPIVTLLAVLVSAFALVLPARAQYLPGAQPGGAKSNQPAMIDRIVAVVEEQVILQSELDQAVEQVKQQYASNPQQLPPPNVLKHQVLNRLILMKLQVQHALQQGIRVSQQDLARAISGIASGNHMTMDQLRQAVEAQGGSFAAFQQDVADQVLISKLRNQVVQDKVQVTDNEVNNLLKDPSFSSAQVHLAHIDFNLPSGPGPADIAAARSRAEKAEQAIRGGMDFHAAAIRYSDGQDALDGGDLGWRGMSQLPEAFVAVIKQMQPGQVSPPVQSPSGFHIFKLIDRRAAKREVVTQYHVRQILVQPSELLSPEQAKAKAEDLYRQLTEKHADFAELARKQSDDDTSANLGGDLDWFQLKEHGPQIAEVLGKLKNEQISKPFETPVGWDIIQLLGTRQQDVTEQMQRQRAHDAIADRKARTAYENFLRDLRSRAYVDIRVPSLRDSTESKQTP